MERALFPQRLSPSDFNRANLWRLSDPAASRGAVFGSGAPADPELGATGGEACSGLMFQSDPDWGGGG